MRPSYCQTHASTDQMGTLNKEGNSANLEQHVKLHADLLKKSITGLTKVCWYPSS